MNEEYYVRRNGSATPLAKYDHQIMEPGKKALIEYTVTCSRCGGAGGADKWAQTGWTCYDCGGRGRWKEQKIVNLYLKETSDQMDARIKERRDRAREASIAKAAAAKAKEDAIKYAKRKDFELSHPDLVRELTEYADKDAFLRELKANLDKWGDLTEAQVAVCERAIGIAKERENQKRSSQWVGEIGKRPEFDLTIKKQIEIEKADPRRYGHTMIFYIIIMEDAFHNVIVYKGSSGELVGMEGERCYVRGTISEHTTWEGTKQTIISRPKVMGS